MNKSLLICDTPLCYAIYDMLVMLVCTTDLGAPGVVTSRRVVGLTEA